MFLIYMLIGIFCILKCIALMSAESQSINEDNSYIRLEKEAMLPIEMQICMKEICRLERRKSFYEEYIKRGLDILLSFLGLIILSPVYAVICVVIFINDPGPVFFTQKRIGKNKEFFQLHKFRSMKMSAPHDVPTHMLENPDQYITSVGKFLRRSSLDELPQIWDIFRGKMSIVGPRPALWNQADLILEREKYNANDVLPGLTGWAQINGRDEVEISTKAEMDGDYVKRISFFLDCRCFFCTVMAVVRRDGIIEGGINELHKRENRDNGNGNI